VASPDPLIRRWLLTKVRNYAPLDVGHWHYRFDCTELQVFEYKHDTHPLSDVTGGPETAFVVTWGCAHRDERLTALIRELGSIPEIIAELEELDQDNGS
jgi:hypothetical protein